MRWANLHEQVLFVCGLQDQETHIQVWCCHCVTNIWQNRWRRFYLPYKQQFTKPELSVLEVEFIQRLKSFTNHHYPPSLHSSDPSRRSVTVVILPSLGSGSKTGGPKCWERCLRRSYYNCSNQNGKMDMKRSSIFVSSFSFFCLVVVFQKKRSSNHPNLKTNHPHCNPCRYDVVERAAQMMTYN